MNDFSLINESGETVAKGSQDVVERMLKHHRPDGTYTIAGGGKSKRYRRGAGIVYPLVTLGDAEVPLGFDEEGNPYIPVGLTDVKVEPITMEWRDGGYTPVPREQGKPATDQSAAWKRFAGDAA